MKLFWNTETKTWDVRFGGGSSVPGLGVFSDSSRGRLPKRIATVNRFCRKALENETSLSPKVSGTTNAGTGPDKAILRAGFHLHKPYIQLI